MDKDKIPADELAAEQEATQEVKEEDIRKNIIEEYGFDETEDADRITKLTAKEVENRKKLSKAIGQKIKLREAAKGGNNDKPIPPASDVKRDEGKMSIQDERAIIRADIHDEDIDDVVKWAEFNKITISEALKSTILKASLAEKAEKRGTAQATNTGTARRSVTKASDEELVAAANAGKLPESDDEINRLMAAKAPKPKQK